MAQIVWTSPALSDLDDIANYIALDNFSAAQRLVQKVCDDVERLEIFPESGRVPPELPDSLYREVVVGPCRVFYRNDKGAGNVYILHVMRSERQVRKYLIDARSKKKS